MRSIVQRNNSMTGVRYCDDPTIMAWDLVNEPFNLGDDTGKVLTVSSTCANTCLHLPWHACLWDIPLMRFPPIYALPLRELGSCKDAFALIANEANSETIGMQR